MRRVARMCVIGLVVAAAAAVAVQLARADSGEIAPAVPSTQPAQKSKPAQNSPPAQNSKPMPTATSATPTPPPPASQPTSRPSLPAEFAVLQTRNIFKHGPSKPGGPGAPGGPEASFVLKGIVEAEAKFTAFIEDKNAKHVTPVGIGGKIALGKIKSINLDAIEYEAAAGGTRRIEVGRNLMGEVVPPTPPTSKPSVAPGPGGAGQPGQPGGPPQPGQPGRNARPGGPPPGEAQPASAPTTR
jgi:translation initiation factor IF-2